MDFKLKKDMKEQGLELCEIKASVSKGIFKNGVAIDYDVKNRMWRAWQITFCGCGVHACRSFIRGTTLIKIMQELEESIKNYV